MAAGTSSVQTPTSDDANSLFGGSKWSRHVKPLVPEDNVTEDDLVFTLAYMDETYVPLSSDGLVKKQIVRRGNGKGLVEGSFMSIHYEVYAFDTTGKLCEKPFDSSWERPDYGDDRHLDRTVAVPKEYRLMEGEVIGVLDAGVATMEAGETANFVARGPYAYGSFAIPGIVGKNAPVFLHVVVLQSLEATPVQKIFQGVLTDREEATLDEIYEAVMEFKKRGNADYELGNWDFALCNYKKGLTWTAGNVTELRADVQRFFNCRFGLLNNMAACFLKLKQFEKVVKYCNKALKSPEKLEDLRGGDVGKMYYRLAVAQFEMTDYDKSKDSIMKAMIFSPFNPDIVRLFDKLREFGATQQQQVDTMWKRIATGFFKQ